MFLTAFLRYILEYAYFKIAVGTAKLLSKAVPFYIAPAMYKNSVCSTSSPILDIVKPFFFFFAMHLYFYQASQGILMHSQEGVNSCCASKLPDKLLKYRAWALPGHSEPVPPGSGTDIYGLNKLCASRCSPLGASAPPATLPNSHSAFLSCNLLFFRHYVPCP